MSSAPSSFADAPLIALEGAEKRYGNRSVLALERFELSRGECLLVTGPNGSGKSTLLRILCGAAPLTKGRIVRSSAYEAMRVYYVPQAGGLYQHLTLAENIRLATRLFGASEVDDLEREWYVHGLGLAGRLDTRCEELSGGYQRVATIACAFAAQPRGLLIDEPLSGIDAALGEVLLRGMDAARREMDFMVVTHHSASGVRFATRVIVLSGGEIAS